MNGDNGRAVFSGNVVFQDSIKIGSSIQTTASSEIAFGSIRNNATIFSGSGNYSVTWMMGYYNIDIDDETYQLADYTSIVTPMSASVYSNYTSSGSGKLRVYLRDNDGNNIQGNFQFVTHKYISEEWDFQNDCGEDKVVVLGKNKKSNRRE